MTRLKRSHLECVDGLIGWSGKRLLMDWHRQKIRDCQEDWHHWKIFNNCQEDCTTETNLGVLGRLAPPINIFGIDTTETFLRLSGRLAPLKHIVVSQEDWHHWNIFWWVRKIGTTETYSGDSGRLVPLKHIRDDQDEEWHHWNIFESVRYSCTNGVYIEL
jgi:hypothetical protein